MFCTYNDRMLNKEQVEEHFAKIGAVASHLPLKTPVGEPRGSSIITFDSERSTDAAINERPNVINGTSVTIMCLKAVAQTKKVHVGNLPTTIEEEIVKQYFAPLGTIVALGVKSRQSSASAWVEFQEVVDTAIFSGRHPIGDRAACPRRENSQHQ
ncbi:hypothetical protein Ciccas_012320 [Cichlidogyrus casuarinus]|uniref:RRM domain-containing protein n=1 Tax=Cichlidogyrus casuarinus TaxID=1844966 RepID=A0ABD2PNP2_9PLAT